MPPKVWTLALLGGLVILSGCSGMTRAEHRPPAPMASLRPQPPEVLNPKKGSIWQSTDRNTLFLDNKARNVGDIVTVQITETASAQKNATTNLQRDGDDQIDLGGLFGVTAALRGKGNSTLTDKADLKSKHDFTGAGTTTRKGSLQATISCVVTEVLPNGNLRIEGRRDITVNNENQYIILSGVIRPEDITHDNSLKSTQIADARIDYSGEGDVNDQQRPGWLNRLFGAIPIL